MTLEESKLCFNCFREWDRPMQFCPYCGYSSETRQEKYALALPVGSVLAGRYLVGSVLGQGGFGITYTALDVKHQTKVAIKEFFPDNLVLRVGDRHTVASRTSGVGQDFLYGKQQFLTEAKILAQLNWHPNIVHVKRYFEENGTAYFVMEFLPGVSLQQYTRSRGGVISWQEAAGLITPVMGALHVAHQMGIIHRDVTPDNIMITTTGEVKLLDFGAARFSLGDRSRSFDVILKAGYAPVEQYARHGRQGPYTDVYAVAATLYAVTTGYLPPESVMRADSDPIIPPSQRGVELSPPQERVLLKALSIQAKDRYPTMEAFGKALLPWKDWRVFSPKRPAVAAHQETRASGSAPGKKPKRRRSLWAWLTERRKK